MSAEWDAYAPFYDWENARTMGRRDVAYWSRFVSARRGWVLELGCGTGRVLWPLMRAGARVAGIDMSRAMLERARQRTRRAAGAARPWLLRGDIRALPFGDASFSTVIAPYGVLQSLTSADGLDAALQEAARVLEPGGRFGVDLVPDLTRWQAYQRQPRFRGRLRGRPVALVESVRQDRRRGLTIFDEEFTVGAGRAAIVHRFSLTFRTIPMDRLLDRIAGAGFEVESLAGSYRGAAWSPDAPVWLVTLRKS